MEIYWIMLIIIVVHIIGSAFIIHYFTNVTCVMDEENDDETIVDK